MLCSNYSKLTLQGQLNSQDLNISGIFIDSEHEVPNHYSFSVYQEDHSKSKDENDHYDKQTDEQSLLASKLLRPKNLEMGLNITFSTDKNKLFYSPRLGETWVVAY